MSTGDPHLSSVHVKMIEMTEHMHAVAGNPLTVTFESNIAQY